MFGIGSIGPMEIALVLIIALVVFGPKRLPELGNSLGRSIREFRGTVTGDKQDDDAKALSASPTPSSAEKPSEAEVGQDTRG